VLKLFAGNLRTRVARDAFATFVVAALLPLLMTGFVVDSAAASRLARQAKIRLQDAAKDYGLSLFGRLELARSSLVTTASSMPGVGESGVFAAVILQRHDGTVRTEGGSSLPPRLLEQARAAAESSMMGSAALEVPGRPAGEILLATTVPDGTAFGLVRPGYLWGDPEHFPAGIGFCVQLASGGRTCRSPENADLSGQSVLQGDWDLFLRAEFGTADWRIEARQAEEEALASLHSLRRNWPVAFGASIGFGVLFSLVKIRRRHAPLEQLMAMTRRIERGVLDQPAAIESRDEYAEVGRALDRAALALNRQLALQRILARLDRAIIHADELDSTVADLLPQIDELLDGLATIAILVQPDGRSARVFLSSSNAMALERAVVADAIEPLTRAVAKGVVEIDSDRDSPMLRLAWHAGHSRIRLWPIRSEHGLAGALGVACDGTGRTAEASEEVGRRIAEHMAVAVSDMSKREELFRRAHYDDLTGLPNRMLLLDRLQHDCQRARGTGKRLAVLFVDLDRFKLLNDSLGHSAGDAMLKSLAERLVDVLPREGMVARLGGDEFLLAIDIESVDDASRIATRVMATINTPVTVLGSSFSCSASIGIAIFPNDGNDADSLLRNADTAMYRGKAQSRGSIVFFEDGMNTVLRRRVYLEGELRTALDNRQLWPAFQAKTDLCSGRLCGAEALARWTHPEQGLISPAEFIPIAEEAGLVQELGWLMLESCCEQMARWRAEHRSIVPVAVNVSMLQLTDSDFAKRVLDTLSRLELPPSCLGIEVTESTLIQQIDVALPQLERLRAAGLEISIDDFGTGYSSLSALRRMPADVLKIDQSFVRDMTASPDGLVIAETIVAMALALGHKVVAEGVETPEQLALLKRLGCHQVQGWLIAPPLPAAEFVELLDAGESSTVLPLPRDRTAAA
jgi:diguanylate cyclase (GGDEF)-like protein